MAMKINEDCIACGACLPECPTKSITEGDGLLKPKNIIGANSAMTPISSFDLYLEKNHPSY